MYQTMNLTHSEATSMVEVIRKKLEIERKSAAVAVVDSHGELIAFLRMDGCHLPPLYVAINKAYTAAREGRPSAEVGASSRDAPFPMTNFGSLRYTGWAGGLPIMHGAEVAGAIGVSGLDESQESELARLAIAALG